MLPVNIGFDPAASLNASCPAPKGSGATPAATGPGSFHNMLRDAAAARDAAPANSAPAHGKDAVNETGRRAAADTSRARPTRRQNHTAGTDTNAVVAKDPANSAPAHGKDAVNEVGCGAADDSHTQPTARTAANDTAGQPVWALLAQIIQNLTAAVDTNTVAVEGEGAAVASGPAAGDAAKDLAALVDLLKQLQEAPAALTAESVIPLDRLRQVLEKWQAGANESQPTGLPGRLLDLIKNVKDALPGIAWDRSAAALARQDGAAAKVALEAVSPAGAKASQDGAAEKVPLETANPTGAELISAAGSQHGGLPIGAGRAARGVLLDAKATAVVAGKADAAASTDELSDRSRPAADERGPGAGRVMPALPPAASPTAEILRSTAVSSTTQASEGSFALSRNFEAASDTQSEVSDDSRSPADKATAGLVLASADRIAEEGGPPSLRFDAVLRDVRSFAVSEGSPDKPAAAASAGLSGLASGTAKLRTSRRAASKRRPGESPSSATPSAVESARPAVAFSAGDRESSETSDCVSVHLEIPWKHEAAFRSLRLRRDGRTSEGLRRRGSRGRRRGHHPPCAGAAFIGSGPGPIGKFIGTRRGIGFARSDLGALGVEQHPACRAAGIDGQAVMLRPGGRDRPRAGRDGRFKRNLSRSPVLAFQRGGPPVPGNAGQSVLDVFKQVAGAGREDPSVGSRSHPPAIVPAPVASGPTGWHFQP